MAPRLAHPRRPPARGCVLASRFVRGFAGTGPNVRTARDWAARALAGLGPDAAETVRLLVGEAVTNAVAHTRSGAPNGAFAVVVAVSGRHARIEVHDAGGAATEPAPAAPDPLSESGRGVSLISVLADEWGVLTSPACGVYFTLSRPVRW
ncbi:ATP-binding protein [Nocardiopsis coralliicola]